MWPDSTRPVLSYDNATPTERLRTHGSRYDSAKLAGSGVEDLKTKTRETLTRCEVRRPS
jgi:hypothetical protein